MVWPLSHTPEAVANADDRIHALPRGTLVEIYGEWLAAYNDDGEFDSQAFDEAKYNAALAHAESLADDVLADYISERAIDHGLTTNGGHFLYACPSGCHLVSFDSPTEDKIDE